MRHQTGGAVQSIGGSGLRLSTVSVGGRVAAGRTWFAAPAVWFALALAVRWALLLQPIAALDHLFVYDDTYYSLAIARNIAHGLVPSVDGVTPTNGFQPLITFLQVPLFLLGLSPDGAARAALFETGFFGACGCAALGLLLRRMSGARAAWAGAIVMALHPSVIRMDLNGLETSLSIFLSVLLLHVMLLDPSRVRGRVAALAGALCAASLMARIDTALLIALLGWHAWRHWPRRSALILVGAASVCIAPWWLYSMHAFGGILPESGQAVRHLASLMIAIVTSPLAAPVAGLSALGRLFTNLAFFNPRNAALGTAVLAAGLLWACRAPGLGAREAPALHAFTAAAMAQIGFYAFYLRATWFMPRYLAFAQVWAIAVLALMLLTEGGRWRRARLAFGGCLAALTAPALAGELVGFATNTPAFDLGDPCPKSYRAMALQILPHVPTGAVLGAMQSGALSYFAPPGISVRNLDGVVNRAAARALAARTEGNYVMSAGLTYFADWALNLRVLQAAWGGVPQPGFVAVAEAPLQSPVDRVTLYRLDWAGRL